MAAYRRVDDIRSPAGDCLYTGISSRPSTRYWVWESLYLYLLPPSLLRMRTSCRTVCPVWVAVTVADHCHEANHWDLLLSRPRRPELLATYMLNMHASYVSLTLASSDGSELLDASGSLCIQWAQLVGDVHVAVPQFEPWRLTHSSLHWTSCTM